MEVTNKLRSLFAAEAIDVFANRTGINDEDEETKLGDLLADILHFCDEKYLDFSGVLERSRLHYQAEIEEESDNLLD